jgi:hypothetical protein
MQAVEAGQLSVAKAALHSLVEQLEAGQMSDSPPGYEASHAAAASPPPPPTQEGLRLRTCPG